MAQLQHTVSKWALSHLWLQEASNKTARLITKALVQAHLAWDQARAEPDLDPHLQRHTIRMVMETMDRADKVCRTWVDSQAWVAVEWDSSQWVAPPQLSQLLIFQRPSAWLTM